MIMMNYNIYIWSMDIFSRHTWLGCTETPHLLPSPPRHVPPTTSPCLFAQFFFFIIRLLLSKVIVLYIYIYNSWIKIKCVGLIFLKIFQTYLIGLSIVSAEMFGCLLSIALPLNVNVSCNFLSVRWGEVMVLWSLNYFRCWYNKNSQYCV